MKRIPCFSMLLSILSFSVFAEDVKQFNLQCNVKHEITVNLKSEKIERGVINIQITEIKNDRIVLVNGILFASFNSKLDETTDFVSDSSDKNKWSIHNKTGARLRPNGIYADEDKYFEVNRISGTVNIDTYVKFNKGNVKLHASVNGNCVNADAQPKKF